MPDAGRRHAVVTGGSSGIGEAIVAALLEQGWRVTCISRRQVPEGPALRWVGADLADPSTLADALADVDGVDAIVHAAGVQITGRLGELHQDALERMLAIHVVAASTLVDALADRLHDGARVVLVGSRTMQGAAGKSHYAATKSALVGLMRSWAIELAPRAITVNVVAPGPTRTPMLEDPSRASVPVAVPPLGALVEPDDVAALTAFVLGPHGGSITGQVLTMCGGASL